MEKVERHFTKGNQQIVDLCITSKELYNKCNYYMRQAWSDKIQLPDISSLVQSVQSEESYRNLHNTKTAKQTIRKVISDWSNFRKSLNAFKKNPKSFKKCPRPPKYKEKMAQVIFYNETVKRKPLKDGLIVPTNSCFEIKSTKKFKQVVITPKTFGFMIDVMYNEEKKESKSKIVLSKKHFCCIDLGVNNLCAITSDQHIPILINGRILKSINRNYNKKPNKRNSRKRYFRIENYFHHVSKHIVDNCIKHNIGRIIIGRNCGWKDKNRMRKVQKQSFQYIPFYNLIQKIIYKAKEFGIEVEFTEESYTSKASYLDKDPLDGSKLSGKRLKRGLYKSSEGILINADVNGSGNIGRKVIQEVDLIKRLDMSVAATPVKVNPLRGSFPNISL